MTRRAGLPLELPADRAAEDDDRQDAGGDDHQRRGGGLSVATTAWLTTTSARAWPGALPLPDGWREILASEPAQMATR